jgi:tetratricopeptide (TPR) repeat protein/transcriptional regulator with XRE-family HTH domain
VAEPPAVSFAVLLRQLRTSAGMTQEQLADRAGLSPRSISDLERGVHPTARQGTTRLLVRAFGLTGSDQKAFEAAARGRRLASEIPGPGPEAGGVAAATRTLPRDVSSFTGREPELDELIGTVTDHIRSGWVADIYAIGGMAGIGKTAFAVHAAHQLAPRFPDGQIFLPMHGHTPGQQPVDPADALASLLQTAGVAAQQIPAGLEPRTRLWRDYLVGKQLLLLLDDAAGHEQVRPLLPGTAGSVVLVTSRRHLTALEDVQAISLDTLTPEAAAGLLVSSAARPGLDAADRAVAEITRLCGYLPLAVGILGRQLHHHPAWTAAGLAADLGAAHHRLELMQAENVSVEAALDLSYQKLTGAQQRLFRRLGLHPGTDVDAYAAAALDSIDLAFARRDLAALYDQHLLIEPSRGRYHFHDLVGEYARERAAEDEPAECEAAVSRLVDYYLQAALAADRHQARRTAPGKPAAPGLPPAYVPALTDRESAVAWMDAERLDLYALVGYAAARARPRPAVAIATAMHGFMRSQGHWHQALTLYRTALDAARQTNDGLAEASVLADLGDMETLTGDYRAATGHHEQALAICRDLGDRLGEANALNKLATVQQAAGDYQPATANLTSALELHRDLGDRLGEANDLNQLGVVQYQTDDSLMAAASHERALELRRVLGDKLGEAIALFRLGSVQRKTGDYPAAAASLTQALALHREIGYRFGEATVLGELGVVQRLTTDYASAAVTQEEALALYRALGYPHGEADALNDLGVILQATGKHPEAADHHRQALELYRHIGSRLGEAEALNNLGEWSLASATRADAASYYQQARDIARDVASSLEEARALEGLGRCQLQSGGETEAVELLSQSLAIYQRISSPNARRAETTLLDLRS